MDSPGSSSQDGSGNENNAPDDDPTTDPTNQPKPTPKATPKRIVPPLTPIQDTDADSDAEMDNEEKPMERVKRHETKADIKRKKEEVEKYCKTVPLVKTEYPRHLRSLCPRRNLVLADSFQLAKQETTTAVFSEDHKTECVFCHSAVSPTSGDTVLIGCHGRISGELSIQTKERLIKSGQENFRDCKSHFHQECIMKYNADNFYYQYAARVECQGRLLCPLHTCSSCNVDHYMQSSYQPDLMECALCLRAFHFQQCYPAGARDVIVEMVIDGRQCMFEMMICPSHAIPEPDIKPKKKSGKKRRYSSMSSGSQPKGDGEKDGAGIAPPAPVIIKNHIKLCHKAYCFTYAPGYVKQPTDEPLIECKTCVRSFHRRCVEVETTDGDPVPDNLCEYCICKETIHANTAVLAYWKHSNSFFLAHTRLWENYPNTKRNNINYDRLGYVAVEWSAGVKEFTVLPAYHVAPLIDAYLKLGGSKMKEWTEAFKKHDEESLSRCPPYLKTVAVNARFSRYLKSNRPTPEIHTGDKCSCREDKENRCSDGSCEFYSNEIECPPECDKKGTGCNNRMISKGLRHPNIELRKTESKGYGVFATAPIRAGEFISEYVGEIIEDDERLLRMNSISFSGDFQANHYMMDITKGWTIDATTYGNLSRYINHSCDPNCKSYIKLIVRKQKKQKDEEILECESRVYIKAEKNISKDEELTFSYQMAGHENLPPCACGAPNCKGTLGGKCEPKDDKESKKGKSSQNQKKPQGGEQKKPSSSNRSRHRSVPAADSAKALDAKLRHGSQLPSASKSASKTPSSSSVTPFKSPKVDSSLNSTLPSASKRSQPGGSNARVLSPLAQGAAASVFVRPANPTNSSTGFLTPRPILSNRTPQRMQSVSVSNPQATRSTPRSVSFRTPIESELRAPSTPARPLSPRPDNQEDQGRGRRQKIAKKFFQIEKP